jgi:tRNA/tmRNA/rRNA uracil-C5-methylase (TrmA/RlmC/RlmD family)
VKKSFVICTGTGTIAQFVSKKAKKSGECSRYKDAKANAVRNNIDNCEFYVGDMKVVFNDALSCNTDNLMLSPIHQETECTKT